MSRSTTKYDQYLKIEDIRRDLRGQAIRGGGVTILSRLLYQCLQIVGTMFLARMIAPGEFGLMAMVTTVTGFFMVFKDLGLNDATIQRAEITHRQVSTLFWINVGFSVVISLLIIVIFSPFVAWFFGEPKLKMATGVSSLSFLFAGMSTQQLALMKRKLQFMRIAFIEIASLVVSSVVAIVLASYGWGYWALVTRMLTLGVVMMAGAWFLCPWRPGLPKYDKEVRSMLNFGANILGFYFVNYFFKNMDNVLIGWKHGAQPLGYYEKAYNLSVAPSSQITSPLFNVAMPVLSRLQDDPEKYKRYYINALTTLAFVGMPIGGYMSARSKDLILLILGPNWTETARIFFVMGFGIGIHILYGTHGWLHVTLGKTERWFKWGIFASGTTVLAFIIGLKYGPMGVATAYTVMIYLLTIIGLWYAGKPIGLKVKSIISSFWKYLFASIIACILTLPEYFPLETIFDYKVRVFLSFLYYILIYLIFVTLLYFSFKPITDLMIKMKELLPRGSKN